MMQVGCKREIYMCILRRIIDSPVHSKDFPSKGAWQGVNMAPLDNPPHIVLLVKYHQRPLEW